MVYWEQGRVETIQEWVRYELGSTSNDYLSLMLSVDGLLRGGMVMDGYIDGDQSYLNWANQAALNNTPGMAQTGGTVTFIIEEHRRALGIALIFQNHYGNTQAAYNAYITYMNATWGQEPPIPPSEVSGLTLPPPISQN